MRLFKKRLSLEQRNAFWRRFDTIPQSTILRRKFYRSTASNPFERHGTSTPSPEHLRSRLEPVFVSPTILGRVRNFGSVDLLRQHLRLVSQINRWGTTQSSSLFDFHPTSILAVDRNSDHPRLLERVVPAPSLEDIITSNNYRELYIKSRYGRQLMRRVRSHGITFRELQLIARAISMEIGNHVRFEKHDRASCNILLLDFNPSSKKPVITFIDHSYSAL